MFPYPEIRNSTSTSERPVRRVSRLARARLNRKQRAELAAALADGALEISVSPTAKQAAMLVAVPVVEVTRVRRNGKPKRSTPRTTETLAEHIALLAGRAYRDRAHRRCRRCVGFDDLAGHRCRAGSGRVTAIAPRANARRLFLLRENTP